MPDSLPISPEIEEQLAALHRLEDYEAVRAMLLEYGGLSYQREVERVRFDILHVAAGDLTRVRSLVNVANRDPRDVMSLEYFRDGGIPKPREWAMVHEVNRKLQARIDAGEVKPYQPIRRRERGVDPGN
jgi:hypothetical protein